MTNIAGFGTIGTLLLLFLTFFNNGNALTCYQCNSAYDPRCGDPFDPYSLGTVNCSFQPRLEHLKHLEPTVCRKISQKTNGELRVVRGCGFINDEETDNKECQRRVGTHDVKAFYCACNTDLCNSAYTKLPSNTIIGILVYLLTMKAIN
ncbi:uncharacterized protein LOC127287325 [Leptopilina boulardi]|uniref:uncharacterized protein LOC127287325 n=1 Tax=Leptopilina boulardi TaxID=63433 RepID=UPI0021F628EA|nr:uncharacterized protein LOC127287325 [Leptopilina boulardi]XP_051170132.1 uncharacterized protein LOC127287325 [Leptopilina boulardi]XP_051170134.1 uncharacterized protein LOC127287325 [Leptopilina boulardi]